MAVTLVTLEFGATISISGGKTTLSTFLQTIIDGTSQPITVDGSFIAVPATALTLDAAGLPLKSSPITAPAVPSTTISSPSTSVPPTTFSPPSTSVPPTTFSPPSTDVHSVSISSSTNKNGVSPISSSLPSTTSAPSTNTLSSTTGSSSAHEGDKASSSSTIEPKSTSGTISGIHNKHISSGDAAGIGVGGAIGGAIIAALLVWLLMRGSRKTRDRSQEEKTTNGMVERGRKSSPPGLNAMCFDAVTLDGVLSQPADDQRIGGEMSKLGTMIKNHVHSYYHSGPLKIKSGDITQAEMEVAGRNMPVSASALISLLSSPKTRIFALRFYLSWVITQRLEPTCDPGRTFLPPEVIGCFNAMDSVEDETPTRMALLSKWRIISAFLLQKSYGQIEFSRNDARIPNIDRGLQTLDSMLFPYVDESCDNKQRLYNLEEIMKRAARFGYLVFSQPSSWKFDWDKPRDARRGAYVVFPGLLQVGDDDGRKMARPRAVVEQEISYGPVDI